MGQYIQFITRCAFERRKKEIRSIWQTSEILIVHSQKKYFKHLDIPNFKRYNFYMKNDMMLLKSNEIRGGIEKLKAENYDFQFNGIEKK